MQISKDQTGDVLEGHSVMPNDLPTTSFHYSLGHAQYIISDDKCQLKSCMIHHIKHFHKLSEVIKLMKETRFIHFRIPLMIPYSTQNLHRHHLGVAFYLITKMLLKIRQIG